MSAEAEPEPDGGSETVETFPPLEAEIRAGLRWFNRFQGPPEELVAWFVRRDGADAGREAHTFDLNAAIEKRRWILRGIGQSEQDQHFEGRSNWLPLVSAGRDILIYESGPGASGVVRRRADRRDLYPRDRAHPVPLMRFATSLLHAADAAPREEEDDFPAEPLEQVLALLKIAQVERNWSPPERLPFFTGGVPRELVDWFSRFDGAPWFPQEPVRSKWKALSLDEAGVARDLVLESGSPALVARLQADPRWVPLFVIDGLHFALYSEERGVGFFQRVGENFDVLCWSRWSTLDAFIAATLDILRPPPASNEPFDLAFDLVDEVLAHTRQLNEAERTVNPSKLEELQQAVRSLGLGAPTTQGLLAWFGTNVNEPGPSPVAIEEWALTISEATLLREKRDLGRLWFPLVMGRDEVCTCWIEGIGVAQLLPSGAIIPMSPTLVGWLDVLVGAAANEIEARIEPGSISRNPMGVWTVDTAPLTAQDLIAGLNALPWTFTRSFCTVRLERADETVVTAEGRSKLVIRLALELVDRMITDLEALQGFDPVAMHWEEVHDLVLIVRPKA